MSEVTRETWENVYSGFDRDRCRDFTGVVLEAARRYLPEPTISPTCKRKGHDWTRVHDFIPKAYFPRAWSETRGCKRCARRGLIVLRTDGYTESGNRTTPKSSPGRPTPEREAFHDTRADDFAREQMDRADREDRATPEEET